MKKVLLATAVAAMAFTSCSQNEEFENAGQKTEISFNTIVSKAVRATELVSEGLKTNGGFKVFSYNTGTDDMSTDVILKDNFMDGITISWSTVDSKWSFTGQYYWPLEDKLQFFAFSPITGVTFNKPDGNTSGYPTFDYTIADVNNQIDLVAVHAKNQTKPVTVGTPVALTFKHILTQINFKLKGGDDGFTYTVNSIRLSDINSKGVFTYNDPTNSVGSWSNTSVPESYDYNASYTDFTGKTESVIATGSNALMLMPQSLGANAKIEIDYSTQYNSKKAFDGTKIVSLKDIEWNAGDKILYTLILPGGADNVTFNPTVDNWNAQTTPEKDAQ